MKTEPKTTESPARQQPNSLGQWLNQHRIGVAVAVIMLAGLALGWNWLATTGLLWLVLPLLPCTQNQ
jgi:hypothetical protein